MRAAVFLIAFAVAVVVRAMPAPAAELVMFESDTCPWCKRWHAEIGGVYAKTPEGRALPLKSIFQGRVPPEYAHIGRLVYTPTFVVLNAGREVGRIVGYPGEDFFWPMLDEIIKANNIVAPPRRDSVAASVPHGESCAAGAC